MPRTKGDSRLARLRTLVGRAITRCAARARDLRAAHEALLTLARRLDPDAPDQPAPDQPAPDQPTTGVPITGAVVRARVEALLDTLTARCTDGATGAFATWVRPKVAHLATVLRRLGDGLYHGYDVPGLPRTANGLEQFYRRVKTEHRRITGRKRAEAFVVRVGGFAVYATAAGALSEAALLAQLGAVPAAAWQQERVTLRANQDRQAKMRRFRLHREASLTDLETRWTTLAFSP